MPTRDAGGDRPRPTAAPERLRIGMVAPPWFAVPPHAYGGTEAIVAALTDQLVQRGHEVTLIAAGPPGTRAQRYIRVYDEPRTHLIGTSAVPEAVIAAEAARCFADLDLDLVHDHTLAGPLLAASRRVPTVVTMHNPVGGDTGDYFRRLGTTIDVVAISDAQRQREPALNWIGTVHNAVDVGSYPFRDEKDDYVLWMGRFSPDKGAHLAIDAARAAGRRILLAGKLREPSERAYFDAEIRRRLGAGVEYVGESNATVKRRLFAGASCLVLPLQWEEPFGLVMVEALASGTPIVTTRRGSTSEIVSHGRTGFIVDRIEELPAAIARAGDLDPRRCRDAALERFDLPVMADGYEHMYRVAIRRRQSLRRAS